VGDAGRGSILFRPVAHEVGGVADYGCEDIFYFIFCLFLGWGEVEEECGLFCAEVGDRIGV